MEVADKNEQEIAESYLSSLVDLTTNSKPLINMLTMLAEENIEHGQTIVDAVQRRITEVLNLFLHNQNKIQNYIQIKKEKRNPKQKEKKEKKE